MTDNMVGALVGSTVAMICITTLVVSIRMAVRTSLRTYGLDDVLITASWVFAMGMFTATMISAHSGLGRHHHDVSVSEYEQFLKLTIATSATYSYGLALAKMSFAVLYIRMLPDRRLVVMNRAIILFLCGQAIEESLIPIFQCKPIAKAWTVGMEGTCLDLPVLWWSGFGFNLCTDLILFIQPVPTLWKLQLPLVKRLGLIAMLSLGLLVVAISVIRMHSVTEMGIDDTREQSTSSRLIIKADTHSSIDTLPRAIETIGQTRRKQRLTSEYGSGHERYYSIGSGSTGRTLRYPLSVLSRPGKASSKAREAPQETLRTSLTGDINSIANLRKLGLEFDCDVERSAGDTVNVPEEIYFPMGN
ncbi:hypothetical protein CTAM01_14458 [Colletotrichum tamarilloi]|uniref:Rhodopsin domain-containing protein n=1 Tax=Colletotrichum tamarilloi TaxID=1209934 RepID=A0ABQ9QPD8_9PEZI|nr:uncharacterized protein CTAM01_14458 [Colletotrichum tamarilloi]KAK1480249.1 hypothetical protein CTAM01_14458 [Colletotrichum tamarilloi]